MLVEPAQAALLVATALHAGFQLTVTLVVYPALASVTEPEWASAHAAHSRRITPLVALVYAGALAGCGWALVATTSVGTWVATTATVGAVLVTALVAAPAHGRLGSGPTPALVRRLLIADRVRCALALVAAAVAVLALG